MKKHVLGGAAVAAVAGLAMGTLSTGVANADTVLNLGTSTTTQRAGDSTITVTIKNHTARLSPGMVALPTTRNAWVSGVVSATINGGKASGGSIEAGYVVGCQVDVGSASVSLGAGADSGIGLDEEGSPAFTPKVSASSGGNIKLAAGEVGTQYLTITRATWPEPGDEITPGFADPDTDFKFTGKSGSLSFADQTIGVDGCAGYAQAKFFAKVKAKSGNSEGYVILWSKAFTLG